MIVLTESIVKSGNSLAVVVPSEFVRKLGIRPKDRVKLAIDPVKGKITYTFMNLRQLPLV
jgi:antitoxin component of MazEF toxin-antitoxin module